MIPPINGPVKKYPTLEFVKKCGGPPKISAITAERATRKAISVPCVRQPQNTAG